MMLNCLALSNILLNYPVAALYIEGIYGFMARLIEKPN